MAAPVTPLRPLKLPQGPSAITGDQRYWRSFRSQQLIPAPNSSPVTHISYPFAGSCSSAVAGLSGSSDVFAITSGSRVQVFSSRTRKSMKSITRFGVSDTAHSGEIRRDARVLVAGGDSGAVQVFDINSRAILKTWRDHKQPVWTTKWSPHELTTLMSASDDKTLRLWDLSEQESVTTFNGHQDYVRCGGFMPEQGSSLLYSGSYDQTVRLWDPRTPDKSIMTFKHAAPIESVLPLHTSPTLLASAGNQISVLDLVAARPLELINAHQKTVTALSLASDSTRVVSGSLDGHVKVFDTDSWKVVAGSKYPSPVLSLSVIPSSSLSSGSGNKTPNPHKSLTGNDDKHLAVGLESGILSLKTRFTGQQKVAERQKAKEMDALAEGRIEEYDRIQATKNKKRKLTQGVRAQLRGIDYDGHDADLVVEGQPRRKKKKLKPWDEALNAARPGKALDLVLELERPAPKTVITMFTTLQHRSLLHEALKNRNASRLLPVLRFLNKHINNSRHILLTTRVAMLVLEMYADNLGKSVEVDTIVKHLHGRVRELVDRCQVAEGTKGMLELVMAGEG